MACPDRICAWIIRERHLVYLLAQTSRQAMIKPAAIAAICKLVVRPKPSRIEVSVAAPRESSFTRMSIPRTCRIPIIIGWKVLNSPPVPV